jgi:hypothetical protein
MKIDKIILRKNGAFSTLLTSWASEKNFQVEDLIDDNDNPSEGIDGLVIFNINQEIDREIAEIRQAFDGKQKPVHNIDINGTLMVGVSNLDLWIERNRCKKILIVGSDTLVTNPNLERYLNSMG